MPNKHVIIIDTEAESRVIIKTALKERGYKVSEVEQVENVIEIIQNQDFAVVLLATPPSSSASAACKALKLSPATRRVPLIFIAAKENAMNQMKDLCIEADDYLVKPFTPVELVAKVDVALNWQYHRLDTLTGLPDKGVVEEEVLRALDERRPFSVLVFRLEKWRELVHSRGYQSGLEVIVLLANVLIKVLSKEGDREDFLGVFDRCTDVAITSSSRPESMFEEMLSVWRKLQPMEEKRLHAPGLLQINAVHLQIKNPNQNVETIFRELCDYFEHGAKDGSYVSTTTL